MKTSKTVTRLASIALLSGLAISGVALAGPASAADAPGVSDDTIRIGSFTSMTGPIASLGERSYRGAAARLDQANRENGGVAGKTIDFQNEDHAFSPQQALAGARKMVSSGGIFTLLSPSATPQVNAAMPYLLTQNGVPIFGTYGGAKDWYEPAREGLFGLYPASEYQAGVLGRMVANDGFKKLMVLYIDIETYRQQALAAEPAYQDAAPDGEITVQGMKLPTVDFAPVMLKIKEEKPDAILALLTEKETVALAKQVESQDLDIQLYTWTPVVNASTLELGGTAVEGMRAATLTRSPNADSPAAQKYREEIKASFPDEVPDFISYFAYGVADVYLHALGKVEGDVTVDKLYEQIEQITDYDNGILPPVTFSKDRHDGVRSLFKFEVKDGEWVAGDEVSTHDLTW